MGLCLVTAGRGATLPLKDILDRPETMWMQFRRRLDAAQPYCKIASHTQEEVRAILVALERCYDGVFPALNLHQWTGAIYTWLTHPLLDPDHSGRVNMDHLMKLVTIALRRTYAAGEENVTTQTLETAAELLTLRRDAVRVLDAPPAPDASLAISPGETADEGSAKRPGAKKRTKSRPDLTPSTPVP